MIKKFIFICLISSLCIPCHSQINGTFIQSWLYGYWDNNRWEKEIEYMKELGMDEIIMADVASRNSNEEPWQCNYPSQISNTTQATNITTVILQQAQKGNMKLYLGLGSDNRWWNWNLCNDNDYKEFSNAMEMACLIARDLHNQYKKDFDSTFVGFYSVYEIWNHVEWNDSQRRSLYATRMAEQFNRLIDTLNAIDPNMPLLFSPFATEADWCANIESTQSFYEEFLSKCHFREIDGILPMDNVGGGGQNVESVEPWTIMYSNAIQKNNGLPQYHANIESFVQPADSLLYDTESTPLFGVNYWGTASSQRFINQLEIAQKYANKIYTFAYPHYQSPNNNIPGIHENLIQYFKHGLKDTLFPTLPQSVKFEITEIQNNHTQTIQDILKISWSDDYYDEKGILRVNLYKEGRCIAYRTSTRSESGNTAQEPEYILYPGFIESDTTSYELGFVDTWGNESRSTSFTIDLSKGENKLNESTHTPELQQNNWMSERCIHLSNNSEIYPLIEKDGDYELEFFSMSGVLIYRTKQQMKYGLNCVKIPNTLQKRTFILHLNYLEE